MNKNSLNVMLYLKLHLYIHLPGSKSYKVDGICFWVSVHIYNMTIKNSFHTDVEKYLYG